MDFKTIYWRNFKTIIFSKRTWHPSIFMNFYGYWIIFQYTTLFLSCTENISSLFDVSRSMNECNYSVSFGNSSNIHECIHFWVILNPIIYWLCKLNFKISSFLYGIQNENHKNHNISWVKQNPLHLVVYDFQKMIFMLYFSESYLTFT